MKMKRSPVDKNLRTVNHSITAIFVVSFIEPLLCYCNQGPSYTPHGLPKEFESRNYLDINSGVQYRSVIFLLNIRAHL